LLTLRLGRRDSALETHASVTFCLVSPGWQPDHAKIDVAVSIFDRFKPRSRAPKDLPEASVEFTEDERPAINPTLERAHGRKAYDDPVAQVMFILGFKRDPKFETVLDAIVHGGNPGVLDIVESTSIEAAVFGNLRACALTVQKLHDECGASVPSSLKDDIYHMIVEHLDETHYGGMWFEDTQLPSDDWVNMGEYSPLFVRGSRVFCLPAPYFEALASIV
jgi:hypothetical protein